MKRQLAWLGVFGLILLAGCGGAGSDPITTPPQALQITSPAPPSGTIGVAYASGGFTLSASGGKAPYTWAPAAGSALPPGLSLSNGVISGIPTAAGAYNLAVTVTDSQSPAAKITSPQYAITISDPAVLTITSGTPPGGVVGLTYDVHSCGISCSVAGFPLTATGGIPPYAWTWAGASGSSTPPGLVLRGGGSQNCSANSNGYKICGKPTIAGTFHVIITVTDFASPPNQVSAPYTIKISNPPPPVINVVTLPVGAINLPYSFTFTIKPGFNQLPITWSETGALPTGLTLATNGVLSGTPTATGSFPITVTATDSVSQSSAPVDFTIVVDAHGFKPTGSMAMARASHTATLLSNGRVLIAGGTDTSGNTATAEIYDPNTESFSSINDMHSPRSGHTATTLKDGRVLIVGGGSAAAEIYDPNSGNFVSTGTMQTDRDMATATLLQDGRVLVAGGQQPSGVLMTAEIFDPGTGAFSAAGNMTSARSQHTATLLSGGKVLLTGGIDNTGTGLTSAELFDPVTGHFTSTGSMVAGREGQTATLLNNNNVLVVGGVDPSTNTVPVTAEVYNPAAGTFSQSGHLLQGVFDHTAILLTNGQVLIAGGIVPNGVGVFTSEIFDPTVGVFTVTGSLNSPRYQHTATLLNDGTILVVGGRPDGAAVLNTAEIYQ